MKCGECDIERIGWCPLLEAHVGVDTVCTCDDARVRKLAEQDPEPVELLEELVRVEVQYGGACLVCGGGWSGGINDGAVAHTHDCLITRARQCVERRKG